MRMSAPGSTASLRTANQHRVVDAIRAGDELSQAEISRVTELAPATVSNIVRVLSTAGFLEQSGGAGRRGATVRISRGAGLVAGVDFGHSHVQVSLGDLAGKVIASELRPLDNDHDHDEGLALARELLGGLLDGQATNEGALRAAGLGLPAPVGRNGVIDSGSILPGWVGVSAADAATAVFGVPTLADNDANLGALAESRVGAGVGLSSMVYLKVASGVGAGLVLDGRVYRGGLGTAGEIGHMTMDENGPLCRCGSRGCLEAYVGGFSLVNQLAPLQPDLTMASLVALVQAEDVGARRLVEDAGRYLGRAAAMIANLLGPEIIVVGGDLATAGDLLIDGVRDGLRRHALEPVEREVLVAPAALGDQSSAVGTILLALDAVELPA